MTIMDRVRQHRKDALSSSELLGQAFAHLQVAHPIESRRRNETIAFLFVVHRETDRGIKGSVDGVEINGDDGLQQWFPKSLITICKRVGDFALITMKGGVAIQRHTAQASLPKLSDAKTWSLEERQRWTEMKRDLSRLRQQLSTQTRSGRRFKSYRSAHYSGRNYHA